MKKLLFPVCAALAIFGCGADNVDDLPCLTCGDGYVDGGGFAPIVSNCEGMAGATVAIGSQTWMKSNLNCNVSGSKCYNNSSANCDIYGRLYNWSTAMALPSSCNSGTCSGQISTPHRGICPSGWHLPSRAEWDTLSSYVQSSSGCSSCDARLLKAASGWNSNGNGTDAYGFSALPGGYGGSGGSFYGVGYNGYWWSSNEGSASYAYSRLMLYLDEFASWYNNDKSILFSVRCLKDD